MRDWCGPIGPPQFSEGLAETTSSCCGSTTTCVVYYAIKWIRDERALKYYKETLHKGCLIWGFWLTACNSMACWLVLPCSWEWLISVWLGEKQNSVLGAGNVLYQHREGISSKRENLCLITAELCPCNLIAHALWLGLGLFSAIPFPHHAEFTESWCSNWEATSIWLTSFYQVFIHFDEMYVAVNALSFSFSKCLIVIFWIVERGCVWL